MGGAAAIRIDFHFDTTCPWCFIGKRRLGRALAQRPETPAEMRWMPFLLNPDLPPEGLPRQTYLERKFGGDRRIERFLAAVSQAGATENIHFDFARIERTPNTALSHRLVRYAARFGCQAEVVEALFTAYFIDGLDIGDIEILLEIGARFGLPCGRLAEHLANNAVVDDIQRDNARAGHLGITGVPAIVIDQAFALAGAQDPEILVRLIDLAAHARSEAAPLPMSF